jgi:hypothetical protein
VGARFSTRSDRPWGPPSLLYNGYQVFSGGKLRPGRDADHSPPSSAVFLEKLSYTSTPTPLWATTVPVTGLIYFYLFYWWQYIFVPFQVTYAVFVFILECAVHCIHTCILLQCFCLMYALYTILTFWHRSFTFKF